MESAVIEAHGLSEALPDERKALEVTKAGPWVSTTGPGPNGRTILGVTFRLDKNRIKIVCACHGSHMSPEEFVQHASGDDQTAENNTGLVSFPNGNPAASARN